MTPSLCFTREHSSPHVGELTAAAVSWQKGACLNDSFIRPAGSLLPGRLFSRRSVPRLLPAAASLCRTQALGWAGFSSCSAQAPEHRLHRRGLCFLSFSAACRILPGQGLNRCLLHWQADSLPLSHQGSPEKKVFNI